MSWSRQMISWVLCGLMIGGILRLAQWYSPELLPWVTGFMLASIALSLRNLIVALGLKK